MKVITPLSALILVLVGCDNGTTNVARVEVSGDALTDLPLKNGFYVSADTPCGEASNATLLLKRHAGIGGARDFCEFTTIVKIRLDSYRVTETCGELFGAQDSTWTDVVEWEIPDQTSFRSKSDAGWNRSFRYCDQSSLPEDWRDADISDLIGN